ncbi:MAG: 50S ribosomal protein L21, partial [Bacteroidales bacterium]|nr:50S ribosomal protein L21 [Bacteroidales bacterium]
MFAIVELGGKQFKVTEGTKLYISRLDAEPDSTVESDKVLLIANDDDVKVGNPNVDGAKITFKVLEHLKGPKVTV